jgi:dTDP-4-amino-4,6-dideoxygalactose transaminase
MMEKPKIAGGKPVREKFLPFAQPLITDEEVKEVSEVLRSGWLTTGPKVHEFQDRFREYIGSKRAVAINSCTGGMHVALTALGIGPGDEVITTTTTFAATGHVIALLGAKPVLVDIEKDTYNIDPKEIEKAVTEKTKAILPVHYAGHPCEMDAIMDIANEHKLFVVEDAAHTVGTDYKGKRIGTIGNATAFSFYAIKNMTTGEGGMITTNDEELADKMQKLLYFGINKDAWKRYEQAGTWYYEIETLGYKYNMDSMQGALGVVQLRKLDGFNKTRSEYAAYLTKRLEHLEELQLPVAREGIKHVWHLYPILVKTENLKTSRNEFIDALRAENIGTSVHFIPLHLHPFYQKNYGYKKGDFPNADYAFERMISLPLYPKMTKEDLEDVATAVEKIVNHFRK